MSQNSVFFLLLSFFILHPSILPRGQPTGGLGNTGNDWSTMEIQTAVEVMV